MDSVLFTAATVLGTAVDLACCIVPWTPSVYSVVGPVILTVDICQDAAIITIRHSVQVLHMPLPASMSDFLTSM